MPNLYLQIQRIDQICSFQLSWGQGQQLNVTIPYPQNLNFLYQDWQRAYLNYYKQYPDKTQLRGRVADSGIIKTPTVDLHAKLVQAEAKLLSEFHNWLRSRELYEIRSAIATANPRENKRNISQSSASDESKIDLFFTCNTPDLERLPWEAWEIGQEFSLSQTKIRFVRKPLNIHHGTKIIKRRPGRMKILLILGDETGLNFDSEKKALASFRNIADVTFIARQADTNIQDWKVKIKETIESKRGWDILFFIGHSQETDLTGGEIKIAPHTALSLSEIAPALSNAIANGLQFALFNSCNGLSIANNLTDLGLSQVAIMREPIHNEVAGEFFLRFLKALAELQDVHEALISVSQYLKQEKNLTYPSTYLIPSLFRHPDAPLFRLEPFGIKQRLKKIIPNRQEAVALLALLIASSPTLPIQNFLLEKRLWTQAVYRHATEQFPSQQEPQVVLLQIDNEFIREKEKLTNYKPINYASLSKIINRLRAKNADVIGIDYLLDLTQKERDRILAKSLENAVNSSLQPTWFVFPRTKDKNDAWLYVLPKIASPNWSLQGEIKFHSGYMQLLQSSKPSLEGMHFTYLLTLAHQLQQLPNPPQPQLSSDKHFWEILDDRIQQENLQKQTILKPGRTHPQILTKISYLLQQMWLHPIVDFSIPPNQIYQRISASELIEDKNIPNNLQQRIVIVGAGGYREAGIEDGGDNFPLPSAVAYWRQQENNSSSVLTGSEAHAYMVHHLLNQRLVIPIPDLLMAALAIFLGKYLLYLIQVFPNHKWVWLVILSLSTTIYGILSLQIYLSSIAILLPWFFPSLTVWLYVTPLLIKRKAHE
ncbi:CHASE2 domain-containing protein [Nostoc linckia FACHB-104]|nr:CHASE2 domain-containing protein [Nostoc linckia FACHB-104]